MEDFLSWLVQHEVSFGSEIEPQICLASAVVRRAFQDLSLRSNSRAKLTSADAYVFLTDGLWDEECVWYHILGPFLVKSQVLNAVHQRYKPSKNRKHFLKDFS